MTLKSSLLFCEFFFCFSAGVKNRTHFLANVWNCSFHSWFVVDLMREIVELGSYCMRTDQRTFKNSNKWAYPSLSLIEKPIYHWNFRSKNHFIEHNSLIPIEISLMYINIKLVFYFSLFSMLWKCIQMGSKFYICLKGFFGVPKYNIQIWL